MWRRNLRAALYGGALLLLALSGCHHDNPSVPPANGATPPPTTSGSEGAEQPAVKTPIKDAVQQMLAQQQARPYSVIPKGTRLLSVNLKDGNAKLDFSQEFSKLADMGESTESKAQTLIVKTLAPIPNVDTVTVTVEGRPFSGQTDWDHLSVRMQNGDDQPAGNSGNGGESR